MTATVPGDNIDWATQDETSPNGNANKVAIPEEFKLSGLKEGEPLPRPYLNQQLNLTGEWVRYLDARITELSVSASAAVIQTIFPVGAIYVTDQDANPATILGVGTWQRIEGRFLVGRSTTDTDFDGIGETGGSKTHNHTSNFTVQGHALTVEEMPSHTHNISLQFQGNNKASEGSAYASNNEVSSGDFDGTDTRTTTATGAGSPHAHNITGSTNASDNLPPYRATNIWRRTA